MKTLRKRITVENENWSNKNLRDNDERAIETMQKWADNHGYTFDQESAEITSGDSFNLYEMYATLTKKIERAEAIA